MEKDREAFEAWCKDIVGVARDLDAACERLAAGRSQNAYDAMIEGGQANDLLALDRARKAVREVIAAPMPPAPAALAYVRGEREEVHPFAQGVEFYPLDRCYVWRRESTQEWVLELNGEINDCFFTSRHSQPLSVKPEDVPGLPSLYESQAGADATSPVTESSGSWFTEDVRRASERQAEFDAGRPSARVMIGVDPACEPSSAVWFCPTCKKSGEIPPPEEKE